MALMDISEPARANPLEIVERMAATNDWSFERSNEDEITLLVRGKWTDYPGERIAVKKNRVPEQAPCMALKTIPILPSGNFNETAHFYAQLGFMERGRWPDEYLIIKRPGDGLELHFWFNAAVDPKENDVGCYVRWDTAAEARALYAEWAAVDVKPGRLTSPKKTDYGLLEFALIDPQGNLVRVGGAL